MTLLMTLSWRFLLILFRTREGEARQLGSGPKPCRVGL